MKNIYIFGSLAYDYIMDFPGYFKDQILPEKIHVLSISFLVKNIKKNFGGTAGNIAFSLALMNESPYIISQAGNDFSDYKKWLKKHQIRCNYIQNSQSALTASAHIITDRADNQITAFHPGAMGRIIRKPLKSMVRNSSILIISPGNLEDMKRIGKEARKLSIPYIFDPGQQLPQFSVGALLPLIGGSELFIVNDYEYAIIKKMLKCSDKQMRARFPRFIVTLGEKGSWVFENAKKAIIHPVKPRKIIDPTGAGDAYRSGLLKGLSVGLKLTDAARIASVVSTYPIEHYGTQEHRFSWAEIKRRYKANY